MSLSEVFKIAKANGKKILIPYITAGDPNWEATYRMALAFHEIGIRVLELGIPFSDPVADGPTNQRAAERGLASGTTLRSVLEGISQIKKAVPDLEIVCFSYLNPIYKMGYGDFAQKAEEVGLSGSLVVDLPPEEAMDYLQAMDKTSVETIFLAAPTTSSGRIKLIESASSGFVYYVSRAGVTGAKSSLSVSLTSEVRNLKTLISTPLAVGFGISSPEQAKAVSELADAVVVGSAIVKYFETTEPFENQLSGVIEFTKGLLRAIDSDYRAPPR